MLSLVVPTDSTASWRLTTNCACGPMWFFPGGTILPTGQMPSMRDENLHPHHKKERKEPQYERSRENTTTPGTRDRGSRRRTARKCNGRREMALLLHRQAKCGGDVSPSDTGTTPPARAATYDRSRRSLHRTSGCRPLSYPPK